MTFSLGMAGLQAQLGTVQDVTDQESQIRTITTAVPFLIIGPDTRSGGMGDAGVAISPDANSIHWNPAKMAFAEKDAELSLSYSPWLRKLVGDMNLAYLSGYKKIGDNQAVGAALRYFSLGFIQFTDNNGTNLLQFKPNEFSLDGAYSIKLSKRFAGGLGARFIYSNLTGGVSNTGVESTPGTAFAVDVAGFYTNDDIRLGDFDAIVSAGFNISNIGSKMSYSSAAQRDFIPMNLRVGPALTLKLDEFNSLTFTVDANKLLVPSIPVYYIDSLDANGEYVVASGRNPNVGVASGIFGSFTDAPGFTELNPDGTPVENPDGTYAIQKGSVRKEEFREINYAGGFEYWYADQFALRGGYFYEHPTKGNRQFFALGAGVKYNIFSFDFSYLIAAQQRNPLANTLRFTLRLNFAEAKAKGEDK